MRGPYGGGYAYRGHTYYRPYVAPGAVGLYARPFVGYPGWRAYGTYGLAPALVGISSLAFLSAGLLVGSYAQQNHTVYVYVVEEDGNKKEYKVDDTGKVLSSKPVE